MTITARHALITGRSRGIGLLVLSVCLFMSASTAAAQYGNPWIPLVLPGITPVDINNHNQLLTIDEVLDLNSGARTPIVDGARRMVLAWSINNHGAVVGYARTGNGPFISVVWDPVNGMRDLPALTGLAMFEARGINDHGQIVGLVFVNDGPAAVLWDPLLGASPMAGEFTPTALNNNGQVIGVVFLHGNGDGKYEAFIWDSVDGLRSLGYGWPYAINDAGQVAGVNNSAGFVWDSVNGRREFELPPETGSIETLAGITADGYVVGTMRVSADNTRHVFIYRDAINDLHQNGSPFPNTSAIAVNDGLVIAGAAGCCLEGQQAAIFRPVDGAVQEDPILPSDGAFGEFLFFDVPSGLWIDPPTASGFDYEMTSDSLFTAILDFPRGFNRAFTVITEGCDIPGTFLPGDRVDFVVLCGNGVHAFGIRGIDPVRDPSAPHFPLRLAYSTPTASLRMRAFSEGMADTTAPTLTVPADITTNATTRSGARVTFAVAATDDSGTATVQCSHQSGGMFAVGTTSVSCTAADPSGNESTDTFTVTVRGAQAQIVDLIERLRRKPFKPVVEARLIESLTEALANPKRSAVLCLKLQGFVVLVKLHRGRAIPSSVADELIADALRIRVVIGCS